MRFKANVIWMAAPLLVPVVTPQLVWAQAPGGQPSATAVVDTDESRIADLIAASHILAERGIIDGRGHVSVRSVKNPTHYFMTGMVPPGEVRRSDIVELDEDSDA